MSRAVPFLSLVCLCAFAPLLGCSSTSRAARDTAKLVEARQLTLRGLDALQQNDWQTAENLFHDAVTASPHDERAHLQYARSLWHRGERSESLKHMQEAVRLSGDAAELLVELGRMQVAVGDLEGARSSAAEAIRRDAQYAAAHALIGDCLLQQGRLEQALESYHLALALDARQPAVLVAVASIYRTWDEPRRVLSTLQHVTTDDLPAGLMAKTYYLRGVAELRLGRAADAAQHLAKAAQLTPTAEVYFELAKAQHDSGNSEAAKLALQAALAQDPAHQASHKLLADLNLQPRLATQSSLIRK